MACERDWQGSRHRALRTDGLGLWRSSLCSQQGRLRLLPRVGLPHCARRCQRHGSCQRVQHFAAMFQVSFKHGHARCSCARRVRPLARRPRVPPLPRQDQPRHQFGAKYLVLLLVPALTKGEPTSWVLSCQGQAADRQGRISRDSNQEEAASAKEQLDDGLDRFRACPCNVDSCNGRLFSQSPSRSGLLFLHFSAFPRTGPFGNRSPKPFQAESPLEEGRFQQTDGQ